MDAPELNRNELEALRVLWAGKELKPAEIEKAFSWPIENATLRSVLVNLVQKGHVSRRLHGKAFRYQARVPKATLLQALSHALARVFSGGSTKELLMQLVETEDIKASDLEIVRAAALDRTRKTKRKGMS